MSDGNAAGLPLRVIVRVDRDLRAELTDASGRALAPARQLGTTPGGGFPLPPANEQLGEQLGELADEQAGAQAGGLAGGQAGEQAGGLAGAQAGAVPGIGAEAEAWSDAALAQALRAIVTRQMRQGSAAHGFARYLFHTLLGDAWWAAIRDRAGGADEIELALCWPADLHLMSRLPWELARLRERGQERFLAEATAPRVAITRMVAGARVAPRPIEHPLRVLFVIGSPATDRDIRPGAEYFGLLRELHAHGHTAQTRVRDRVTPEILEREVTTFRPDVVHFVCHGTPDPAGGGAFLELYDPQTGGRARVGAARLIECLQGDAHGATATPPIVLLSACYSGAPLTADRTAPLAAELVAGGVPIVVGMAGRISDLACRLFTRRFAAALVAGAPLVAASAAARREVLIGVDPARQELDWALPGVFVSEAVPPGHVTATSESNRTAALLIDRWLRRDDVRRMPRRGPAEDQLPAFCGRDRVFDAYYDMLSPRGNTVLALHADSEPERLGKTRTLTQLTAQAVRDGHVPLPLLVEDQNQEWRGPETLEDLAGRLLDSIRYTRELYELDDAGAAPGQLDLALAALAASGPAGAGPGLGAAMDPIIASELARGRQGDALRRALASDLARLRDDARARHRFIAEAGGEVIVLLDEVHRYGADVIAALSLTWLKTSGLGAANHRVPVVLAFSRAGAPPALADLVDPRRKPSYVSPVALSPFPEEDDADMQVYEHVLLHPFLPEDEYLRRPWAFNYDLDDDQVQFMVDSFRKYLRGCPGYFFGRLSLLVHFGREQEFVLPASDEDLLDRLRQE